MSWHLGRTGRYFGDHTRQQTRPRVFPSRTRFHADPDFGGCTPLQAHRRGLKLPMLFKIVNNNAMGGASPQNGAPPAQFCGVLEFSAPDEKVSEQPMD